MRAKKYTPKLPSYTFTPQGYEDVKRELEELTAKRPAAVEDLSKARALGDLRENGYYKAARQKLNDVDHRLRMLRLFVKYGKVIEATDTDTVGIGNRVTVWNGSTELTYSIVGSNEAKPAERKLSDRSPIGRALMGKKVGDIITVQVPSGELQLTLKQIS
jgi:transcription elongation factor GreA